jgi:hypothetical protein
MVSGRVMDKRMPTMTITHPRIMGIQGSMVISQELRALERTSEDITATPNRKKIAALFQCQFYQANYNLIKKFQTNKQNN